MTGLNLARFERSGFCQSYGTLRVLWSFGLPHPGAVLGESKGQVI